MANKLSNPQQVVKELVSRAVSGYKPRDDSGLSDVGVVIYQCCYRVLGYWYLTKIADPETLDYEKIQTIADAYRELTGDDLVVLYSTNPNPDHHD